MFRINVIACARPRLDPCSTMAAVLASTRINGIAHTSILPIFLLIMLKSITVKAMSQFNFTPRFHPGSSCFWIAGALLTLLSTTALALTPIARWDTVPYQRVTRGETANLGVVAFSKAGIDRVDFTVSGQGYSGANPLRSSEMTYNSQTNVYEYWVPLRGEDFATNGAFTIAAVVHGKDGGTRDLGALQLVANATGSLPQPKAWVSKSGSDSTGSVNDRSKPFSTVGGAAKAIQSVNGGRSDGGIIYLFEGSYPLDGAGTTINTSSEWLTLTRDSSASIDKTILDNRGSAAETRLMKSDGLTLKSSGALDYVFSDNAPTFLWVNNCRLVGADRWIAGSNPVKHGNSYLTNSYITNVDRAVGVAIIARGLTIEHIGEDGFQNAPFVVNIRLNDQDPGSTYWHADGYQSWGAGPENRIIYNYYGTDMHYQGLFMRATDSMAHNDAYINIFMEMREPGRPGYDGGKVILVNGALYGPWDHVLMWHNTFPSSYFNFVEDTAGYGFTNSSFIGNVFYEYRDPVPAVGVEPAYSLPGNSQNNEFLFNHAIRSYTDLPSDNNCVWPLPPECPHIHSKSPDSSSTVSQSVGDPKLDLPLLSIGDPVSATFGAPLEGSPLINRITRPTVPADVFGYPRDALPDVGAREAISSDSEVPLEAPSHLEAIPQ